MPENEVADQSMLPTQVSTQRSMVSGPNLGFDTDRVEEATTVVHALGVALSPRASQS